MVRALSVIPRQPDTAGKTFQLADPNPLSARELTELVARRLGAPRPRLQVPVRVVQALFKIPKLVELSGMTPEAFAYVHTDQVFDTTHVRQALDGTGVACPPLPSYINQILRYYRDRVRLPWRFDKPS